MLFSSLPHSPVFLDTTISSITTSQLQVSHEENEEDNEDDYSLPVSKRGVEVKLSSTVAGKTLALSHAPSTKWSTLSSLEQIRERNKPEEAPKAPEKAPFFLPTTSSLTPEFIATPDKEEKEEKSTKRFVTRGDVLNVENEFQRLLRECATGKIQPLNTM